MGRILSKKEWLRRRKRNNIILEILAVTLFMIIIALVGFLLIQNFADSQKTIKKIETISKSLRNGIVVQQNYLTPNPNSRPQKELKKVKGIVIHYTANPGTSADNNRSYFESLATTKKTSASSHFIIGLEGEIIQCIPLNEISYASNERNEDTISIECCHLDETGKFNKETYDSLVALTAELCIEFDLNKTDIIRHYDVTGKMCPIYYVEHEDEWKKLKDDIMAEVLQIEKNIKK